MINRPDSTKASWLRYPVFFIAALTVAAAFARPQHIKTIGHYIPDPILETITSATDTSEQSAEITIPETYTLDDNQSIETDTDDSQTRQLPTQKLTLTDSLAQASVDKDSVRSSPSRYIVYQDNRLWWIITPKATLDDFEIIKKELAKHGAILQFETIKFDSLNRYIDRLDYTLLNTSSGGSSGQEGDGNAGQPIRTTGGYLEWKTKQSQTFATTSYTAIYPSAKILPDAIRKIIIDDEAAVSALIKDQKMEELVQAGQRKYGHLGMGFRRFDKDDIKKQSSTNSSVRVNADSSLTINEGPGNWKIKAFINNEPASLEAIGNLSISQIYTLAVILGYDAAQQKRSGIDYLLFYINKAN